MTISGTHDVLPILQECFDPREDGWLWLATYVDGRQGGALAQIEGDYEDPAAVASGLAQIISDCGADRCYLALNRRDAQPTEGDRELWRDLCRLVDAERLIDLVVFNRDQAWSMRAETGTPA